MLIVSDDIEPLQMASTGQIVKSVYKSKTATTNCGFCKKPVKTENLKNHCVNVHKKPRLADGERSISSLFKSSKEVESNLSDIEDTEEVEDNFEQLIADDVGEARKKRKLSEDTQDDIDHRTSGSDTGEKNSEVNNNTRDNCHSKLDILVDKIDDLKLSVDVLKARIVPDVAKPCEAQPSDERVAQLLLCKSLRDILDSFCELSMKTECLIICDLCYSEQPSGGCVSGQFNYRPDRDAKSFSHLKSH